jgi:hypothetical protein
MVRVVVGGRRWQVSERVARMVATLLDAAPQISAPEQVHVSIDCKGSGVRAKVTVPLEEAPWPG